ncbi:histidine kinase [Alkalilimnicola ehrlichii]|uniref:Histidine kinase n=1 Tax=Alkalilimnicola ehrlichii TaxID=351052 RepID=A0A3E0WZU9_9GAMM|nr:CBS domain-containing protein [Alkalilimnicola ehrlichii]RFA28980.1 histidine kinase [Alkalilimnicola ehrlichii]RFA38617.1 histidine kinase [Alkalilimnicola ehrlichii]
MAVSELCNREVVIVRAEESVQTVAELMRGYHVGDVVVVKQIDGKQVPVGMVTDRDVVIEVMAVNVDPLQITAGDLMSTDLVTVDEREDLPDATAKMRRSGVRRVVVVDSEGALVGILTVDDILEILAEELNDLSQILYRQVEREEAFRTSP